MWFFYDIAIQCYLIGIRLAASLNPKAKAWLAGRQKWQASLRTAIKSHRSTCWMHCASLGEFEQGRPLLEAVRKAYPDLQIVLSFFSPSGYTIRKNYEVVDHVCYLPLDTLSNAQQFLDIVQPNLVIFVKYDFWLRHLQAAQHRAIPCLLISGAFRPDQFFFKWYGSRFQHILKNFDHLFLQSDTAIPLLEQHGFQNYSVNGDTRIDRVLSIAQKPRAFPLVQNFVAQQPCLILGSSWLPEEQLVAHFLKQHPDWNWKIIIAPHNISPSHLQQIEGMLPCPVIRYTKADTTTLSKFQVLLIDNIGMLAHCYAYATIAFIGGGFGAGLHNTLEAAAHALPMLFGPRYQQFEEANYFIQQKAAICIQKPDDLATALQQWSDSQSYAVAAQTAHNYLQLRQGATKKIIDYIEAKAFFTPHYSKL